MHSVGSFYTFFLKFQTKETHLNCKKEAKLNPDPTYVFLWSVFTLNTFIFSRRPYFVFVFVTHDMKRTDFSKGLFLG